MSIMYKCSWRGCSKICKDKGYCDRHRPKMDEINRDRDRKRHTEYSTNRKLDKEQKKYQEFYSSDSWKRCRLSVISNIVGVDVVDYYRIGKATQGYTVHHIVPLEDDWSMRLDKDNLIYLSQSNHIRVHQEYLKGSKEKKAMQKLLLGLKEKFIEEFGL